MLMRISHLDHLVITVADSERTVQFYRDILGMNIETFGDNRLAIRFGDQKINVHAAGQEFQPHAASPTRGSADLCFISPVALEDIISGLKNHGVAVELGPVQRTGAIGAITSVYIRDPDGNLIEIANQNP
jgi:catechol 2,3-dioxygenase-like lactoylglutathione lyase family enzyme